MKKAVLLLCLIALATGSFASHANKMFMKRPMSTWTNFPASIKDVEMDVTPEGIFARIDLTFTIGPVTSTSPQDSQEAVIFFDLPAGSYVHDSWLWLDPVTIISAELLERRKASEIYANIVKRRKDPSLLYNVLDQNYMLNIFPVTSNYWRKVKISYSTPVQWVGDRGLVPLPLDLLSASSARPAISLNVHTNGLFDDPRFAGQSFGSWVTGQTWNNVQLSIPATGYSDKDLTLSYRQLLQSDSRISIYPTAPDEGYYELIVPSATASPAPRYINLIVDYSNVSYNQLYTPAEVKRMVQHALTAYLRPIDYFNVFYLSGNGSPTSLFPDWHLADSAGLNSIDPAFAGKPGTLISAYTNMLQSALSFTADGPASAETILLNGSYYYIGTEGSTFLKNHSSTSKLFSRRIRVVHYDRNGMTGTSGLVSTGGFNGLLMEIVRRAKGSFSSPTGLYIDGYTNSQLFEFSLRDALFQALATDIRQTRIYHVDLPITGFTYDNYTTGTGLNYSPDNVYTETGRYYGTFRSGDSIRIDYKLPAGMQTSGTAVQRIIRADSSLAQAWNYFNNRMLAGFGNTYQQEIIDSSVRHRVLSDFTAFLALEHGDTIKAMTGGTNSVIPSAVASIQRSGTLSAYPNPFRDALTIESAVPMEEIRIYNMAGRLILAKRPEGSPLKWTWDGRDGNGISLPAGVYLVRVSGNNQSTALRITRLGD